MTRWRVYGRPRSARRMYARRVMLGVVEADTWKAARAAALAHWLTTHDVMLLHPVDAPAPLAGVLHPLRDDDAEGLHDGAWRARPRRYE